MKKRIVLISVVFLLIAVLVGSWLLFGSRLVVNMLLKDVNKKPPGESLKSYRLALKIAPDNSVVLTGIARLYFDRADFQQAVNYSTKAIDADSDEPGNYYIRGKSLLFMGRYDKAIASLKKALELKPGMHTARRSLATAYYQKGDVGSAIDVLKEVTLKKAEDPEAFSDLYGYLLKAGRKEEAENVLNAGLKLKNPPRRLYVVKLAYYKNRKDKEKFDALLDDFLEKYPANPAAAAYLEKEKKYKQAEEVLKNTVKTGTDHVASHMALISFYRRRKKYDKAMKAAERLLMAESNTRITPRIYFLIGLIAYEKGDYEKSEKELMRSLSITRKSPVSLNMLAWLYLTAPPGSPVYKPKKALSLSRKAVTMSSHYAYVDTLARAYYANGQYEKSITCFKQNVQTGGSLDYAHYGLAVNNYRLGNKKIAKRHLEKAFKLGFDNKKLAAHDMDIPELARDQRIIEILNRSDNGDAE